MLLLRKHVTRLLALATSIALALAVAHTMSDYIGDLKYGFVPRSTPSFHLMNWNISLLFIFVILSVLLLLEALFIIPEPSTTAALPTSLEHHNLKQGNTAAQIMHYVMLIVAAYHVLLGFALYFFPFAFMPQTSIFARFAFFGGTLATSYFREYVHVAALESGMSYLYN